HESPFSTRHPSSIQPPVSSIQSLSIPSISSISSISSTHKPPIQEPQSRQAHVVTYRELNEKANRLAHLLQSKGVGPGTIVAIMLERSIEMIIGLLGILKAGGTYLPIDPGYPEDRINYMLKDSNAKIVIKEIGEFRELHELDELKDLKKPPTAYHLDEPASGPAYIIYTSGTTGRPKGVLIEHRSVLRLVTGTNYIEISGDDRLLLTGAFVFDITTFEIWGPLLNGAGLYLVPKDYILDAAKLETILTKNKISILHLIPQLFNQVAHQNPRVFAGLNTFLVGGDQVVPREVNKIRKLYKKPEILHMYGPTENTTFSTYFPVRRAYDSRIPIGKPLTNSTVYITDKY
ncbi:MAG: AMP-binding protein, partial [bacterium]|nr:AMP-binding protein [bacterium]